MTAPYRSSFARWLITGLFCLGVAPVHAQDELWPGADYDPAVPTLRQVLGHGPGERVIAPADLFRYLEALAAASPDRIRLFDYAKSWEGRRLGYAVIGSAANLTRLDEIRVGMDRLADPRGLDDAEAARLVASLPAVVWLSYGVHGDEISSSNAALMVAYHLLAARADALVDEVLADAIVVVNPTQNPDGRERFLAALTGATGIEPSPLPFAAEHDQPWPGGRTNHYLFDLNRDWVELSQPETHGLQRVLREWHPLVHVDFHEMGADSTYFFPPTAEPANPNITAQQLAGMELFGRNNAAWFDRFGFAYFSRDVFDAFYPGYGDMLPTHQGAIGMTYEQAGATGLVVRRGDGSLLTFRDGVQRHFVASLATAQTAARNRPELLRGFLDYRRSAVAEGRESPVREYALPRRGDVALVDELAALLVAHGVEVRRSPDQLDACGEHLPAGSYFVSLAQPLGRLVHSLLDPEVPLEPDFVAEQERLRAKGLPHQMYDVLAWSLPLSWNLDLVVCARPVAGSLSVLREEDAMQVPAVPGEAGVAYLVPWGGIAAGRFLAGALRSGLVVASSARAFTQGGRSYPRGTLVVRVHDNSEDVHATVAALARETGAEVVATGSGWVDEGAGLGADDAPRLSAPEIGVAWDEPTAPSSAGALRYVLERRFGYPVTPVRTRSLASADLDLLDVLLLPDGGDYVEVLGKAGIEHLARWVDEGGVLVALGDATAFLASKEAALLDVAQEDALTADLGGHAAPPEPASGEEPDENAEASTRVPGTALTTPADLADAVRPHDVLPDVAPGVLVRAEIDPDHWLSAGAADSVNVLVDGSSIFSPIRRDRGTNVVRFAGPDDLVVSGHLWDENRRQLAYKPFVIEQRHGRGLVIAFTADPTFRAALRGLDVLLLNAVFRAPAYGREGL